MNDIKYVPIGTIHSQFKKPNGTPIQTSVAKGTEMIVKVFLNLLKD